MTVVREVTASRDYPEIGVKRREKYFRWSLMVNGKWKTFKQKEYPSPEQLTTSDFQLRWLQILKRIEEFDGPPIDDLGDIILEVEDLGRHAKQKFDNMPDGPKVAKNGILLEKRVDACKELASFLEKAKDVFDDFEDRACIMERFQEKRERASLLHEIRALSRDIKTML